MNPSWRDIAAAVLLAVLLAALAWGLARRRRRVRHPWPLAMLYAVNWFFNRFVWRTQVIGRLPDSGGAIIISNHRAGIDPLLIQMATARLVHWMVAREYMEHWSMRWAFRILQSIPVNRGGVDTAATKQALRIVQQGGLVGMFPEGRINRGDDFMMPGRPGAALIALKARVPVIPCYIQGAPYNGTALGSFLMPARVRVRIGDPIDLAEYFHREPDKQLAEELTLRFMAAIAELAGMTDFTPTLAGRRWKPGDDALAAEG